MTWKYEIWGGLLQVTVEWNNKGQKEVELMAEIDDFFDNLKKGVPNACKKKRMIPKMLKALIAYLAKFLKILKLLLTQFMSKLTRTSK